MNDVLRMYVLERLDDLADVIGSLPLGVSLPGPQVFVELPLGAVLEDEVDFVVVEEETVKLHNVRMLQMTLDLNFSPELIFYASL